MVLGCTFLPLRKNTEALGARGEAYSEYNTHEKHLFALELSRKSITYTFHHLAFSYFLAIFI